MDAFMKAILPTELILYYMEKIHLLARTIQFVYIYACTWKKFPTLLLNNFKLVQSSLNENLP
jgi:hypothetical protein